MQTHRRTGIGAAVVLLACATWALPAGAETVRFFAVAKGDRPHDVAADPKPGGHIYYTAQSSGKLGILDPASGRTQEIPLGPRAAPHGVIVGPDGGVWITEGGQNAIVRFDPRTRKLRTWPLPKDAANANLNTLTFDKAGRVWFTGQSGIYGRVDPVKDEVKVWPAPRGAGPYGITTTPSGEVYYVSLAGSYLGHIDTETGRATVLDPPTRDQGARRVWSDSKGRLWISYWNTGHVGMYDPGTGAWHEWKLPGQAHAYAVWVDPQDKVWLTDWSTNAIVRFDPTTEHFTRFESNQANANVRELQGRAGEAWGAESGTDRLVVVTTP